MIAFTADRGIALQVKSTSSEALFRPAAGSPVRVKRLDFKPLNYHLKTSLKEARFRVALAA
jgi:hypothetical protein